MEAYGLLSKTAERAGVQDNESKQRGHTRGQGCEKERKGVRRVSPAERPEPGEVVGVIHAVADGDDLVETLDLHTEHLQWTEREQRLTFNTPLVSW